MKSALENITLPSTLRKIECCAFAKCRNLKRVEFSEGMESLGRDDDNSSCW